MKVKNQRELPGQGPKERVLARHPMMHNLLEFLKNIYMQATNTASKLLRQMMINWQLRLKKTDYDKPATA